MQRSPEAAPQLSPRDIVRSGLCIGCGSCASSEPSARMAWDATGFLKPSGPRDWYERPSEHFARQCPFSPTAADEDAIAEDEYCEAPLGDTRIGRFRSAHVGHVAEGEYRANGSSGGLVSWVAAELLRTGRVDGVAHAAPSSDGRFFAYRVSRSLDEIAGGAKSRYYPVELSEVLREIRTTPGRYAVVGVPCFIKAINLLRRVDPIINARVTHTLGLFCGHMKSAHFVESFAWQLGTEIERVEAVDYRIKDPSRPANWYRATLSLDDGSTRAQDWWHLADGDWGAGFFQNSACNACDDVVAETADIAFGDAWVEPYSSDGRGTNVVIVRSAELHDMVEQAASDGRLSLKAVDADFIAHTQAAGLRQRREGLAYRLSWARSGIRPRKRVEPGRGSIPWRRRLVYRSRAAISRGSLSLFALARRLRTPAVYLRPALAALRSYQGLTYSRGRIGALFDWFEQRSIRQR